MKVGDTLWGECEERAAQFRKVKYTIDKIGHKYAYSGSTKISLSDMMTVESFRPIRLYATEQEIDDIQERRDLMRELRVFFGGIAPLTLDQLRSIHKIVKEEK